MSYKWNVLYKKEEKDDKEEAHMRYYDHPNIENDDPLNSIDICIGRS